MTLFALTIVSVLSVGLSDAQAAIEHQLIRRVVVFPMQAARADQAPADEAWWQMREELTQSRRFLVASKQFLVRSDTFQARGELEPADAIILGKLLDAHALVTSQLKERVLSVEIYDGSTGLPLWKKSVTLHPSLTVQEQLPKVARALIADFVGSIPYQGYTIVDSMIGKAVFEEGDVKLAQVDLGVGTGAQIGDLVQWIKLVVTKTEPVFQAGAQMSVIAEGKVVRLDQGVATVEITRATRLSEIKEYSLVRVPREAERMQAEFTVREARPTTLTPEIVTPEANPMEQIARERKPLVTTLSFVSSIAAFLLLAF